VPRQILSKKQDTLETEGAASTKQFGFVEERIASGALSDLEM